MSPDDQVYAVVAAWEEARERGSPVRVEAFTDDPAVVAAALKVLEELNRSADADATHGPASPAAFAEPPDVPPEYEFLGELGRSGMGVVYKARDRRLGRVVALKMILAGGYAVARHLARFRTEAAAVAALQHPNVVQIFETGEHADRPYLALEFVPGGSLSDRFATGPLDPGEAARLTETLAHALQAAHTAGRRPGGCESEGHHH